MTMENTELDRTIYERFAHMEARPEMWAGTQEAFGLQLVVFAEMLLWPNGDSANMATRALMKRLFGPGPVVSTAAIDADWARTAVATTRTFLAEHQGKPHTASGVTDVRYDVMGLGHDAYRDLLKILGGPCVPQIVGWCDLVLDGIPRCALVVTQAWPFLPLGTDPAPIKKAKRWAALVPSDHGFRIVEVPAPPSTQGAHTEAAP